MNDEVYCYRCHGRGIVGRWDCTCPRCKGTGIEPDSAQEENDREEMQPAAV